MFGKPTQVQLSPTPDDALLKRFMEMAEGEQISHDECARILRHPYKSMKYYIYVRRASRKCHKLTDYAIVTMRGEGFMKVLGNDQVKYAGSFTRKASRNLGRAYSLASSVDDSRLDKTGRAVRDFVVTRTKQFRDMMRSESRSITLVVNKPDALPAPPNPQ